MSGRSLWSDARGASRLAIDLTLLTTDLVETMHHNISRRPGPLGTASFERTTGVTGLVYGSVRGITRLVGGCLDLALAPVAMLPAPASESPRRDAIVAALNGILGDRLEASESPLAIPMQLRLRERPLELTSGAVAASLPHARSRVVVMVHGLCMDERHWQASLHDPGAALARDLGAVHWQASLHDPGAALARDLGADVLYLRYNSGRHVSSNGGDLAALLEGLVSVWPVPLTEIVLLGHSMGGLLIRSACASAERAAYEWVRRLGALVFLGTPHHGAPLERGGQGVDLLLAASPYAAAFTRLSRIRSAGITDLRHGSVLDEDWLGRDRFAHREDTRRIQPLPVGVPCFAIAGSLSRASPRSGARARGDGLVPVASALGQHADPRRTLNFAQGHQHVAYGVGHLALLENHEILETMRGWLLRRLASTTSPKPNPLQGF